MKNIIIYKNANIVTLAQPARASAMAVSNLELGNSHSQILAIGSTRQIETQYGKVANHIVDLKGCTVVPAFTDSHIHFVSWAQQLAELDLDGATSLKQCLELVAQRLTQLKPQEWLVGGGWNWNAWTEQHEPNRAHLDAIAPSTPVVLKSKDWHTLWCNTAALKAWDLISNPPKIDGGLLELEPGLHPSGLLRENLAFHFMGKLPPIDDTKKCENIMRAQEHLRAKGIFAIHSIESLHNHTLLQDMAKSGLLTLRIATYILASDLGALEKTHQTLPTPTSEQVRIVGIKVFTDGSLGSRTAHLIKPYEDTAQKGLCTMSEKELLHTIARAQKQNLPCAVHAIGDAANRMVLNAFSKSRKRRNTLPHRIEHCQLLTQADIKRFASLNVVASVQPSHLVSDMEMLNAAWGKRSRFAYAFGSLLRSKALVIFGSDAPVESPNPLHTIRDAVHRRNPETGKSHFSKEERLTVLQALRASTYAPAKAIGEQSFRGSLAVGNRADFVCINSLRDLVMIDSNIGAT